jgi:hypothetical protein
MTLVMRAHTRRAVAFIAGQLISSTPSTSVRDVRDGREHRFVGTLEDGRVEIRDGSLGCPITGSGQHGAYELFHGLNRRTIKLDLDGSTFSGYDYDSLNGFRGRVSGHTVSLYDNELRQDFSFRL